MSVTFSCAIFVVCLGLARCTYVDIGANIGEDNQCWSKRTTQRNVLYCRRDASFYWDVFFDEPVPEGGLKAYCCAHHDYFHCAKRVVKEQCNAKNLTEHRDEVTHEINIREDKLSKLCHDKYKVGSWKCEMPVWGTCLCLLGFLGFFGFLAYILFGVMAIQP